MMLLEGGGKEGESGYGWRWQGGTHPTGAKKSYKTNLLPLSAKHKQCFSRSALLGLTFCGLLILSPLRVSSSQYPETFSCCREIWGKPEGVILENHHCISFFFSPGILSFWG